MSANKPRKAGEPVYRRPKLRLVSSPDERPAPAPDPELKGVLEDLRRRSPVQRERVEHGSDDKDAA